MLRADPAAVGADTGSSGARRENPQSFPWADGVVPGGGQAAVALAADEDARFRDDDQGVAIARLYP